MLPTQKACVEINWAILHSKRLWRVSLKDILQLRSRCLTIVLKVVFLPFHIPSLHACRVLIHTPTNSLPSSIMLYILSWQLNGWQRSFQEPRCSSHGFSGMIPITTKMMVLKLMKMSFCIFICLMYVECFQFSVNKIRTILTKHALSSINCGWDREPNDAEDFVDSKLERHLRW